MPGPRPARQLESPESRGPHICSLYRAMACYTTGSTRVFVTNGTASPAIIFISGCRE